MVRKFSPTGALRRPFDEAQAGGSPAADHAHPGEYPATSIPEQPAPLERAARLLRRREAPAAPGSERFRRCVQTIADLMAIPIGRRHDEILVFGPDPAPLLKLCEQAGYYDADDLDEIARNLLGGESYFLPDLQAVFLSSDTPHVVAEEAAHFIRHVSGGSPDASSRADLFYQLVMHEALGFFGSRLIDPARETPGEAEILSVALYPCDEDDIGEDELLVYELAALHLQAERDEAHLPYLGTVHEAPAYAFVGAAHLLGYSLADELERALELDVIGLREIRALYFENWAPRGAAFRSYLELRSRVGLSEESLTLELEEYLD